MRSSFSPNTCSVPCLEKENSTLVTVASISNYPPWIWELFDRKCERKLQSSISGQLRGNCWKKNRVYLFTKFFWKIYCDWMKSPVHFKLGITQTEEQPHFEISSSEHCPTLDSGQTTGLQHDTTAVCKLFTRCSKNLQSKIAFTAQVCPLYKPIKQL